MMVHAYVHRIMQFRENEPKMTFQATQLHTRDLILENPTYRAKMKNQVIGSLGNGNRNGTFDTVLAAMVAEL